MAAGKPVVSVDLPEIRQFGSLVYRAGGHEEFLERVGEALREADGSLKVRRMTFASEQTWAHRAKAMDAAIASLAEPRVSVIVLACNNIAFTRACLHSLAVESNWRNLEIIVIDNASDDGTRDFLREWAAAGPGRRVNLNRPDEHTSELQSLMRISYAVFCLKKKKKEPQTMTQTHK